MCVRNYVFCLEFMWFLLVGDNGSFNNNGKN